MKKPKSVAQQHGRGRNDDVVTRADFRRYKIAATVVATLAALGPVITVVIVRERDRNTTETLNNLLDAEQHIEELRSSLKATADQLEVLERRQEKVAEKIEDVLNSMSMVQEREAASDTKDSEQKTELSVGTRTLSNNHEADNVANVHVPASADPTHAISASKPPVSHSVIAAYAFRLKNSDNGTGYSMFSTNRTVAEADSDGSYAARDLQHALVAAANSDSFEVKGPWRPDELPFFEVERAGIMDSAWASGLWRITVRSECAVELDPYARERHRMICASAQQYFPETP